MSQQTEHQQLEDFFADIRVDQNGCYLWEGSVSPNGYGVVNIGGRTQSAHRFSWEQEHEEIEEGLNILHSCDVKRCLNPEHMSLGSQQQNMDDKVARGRINQNPRPSRKVEPEEVAAMAKMHAEGLSWYRIGITLDRSQQQAKFHVERYLGIGSAVTV
jgi:hypothetical protein